MPEIKTNSQLIPVARSEGETIVASVVGDIDLRNSPNLREVLLELVHQQKPKKVILNLEKVPYMDSSAIAALVESLQRLRKAGGRMFLTNLQPRVKGLLEIARLDSIFGIVKDEAEALAR